MKMETPHTVDPCARVFHESEIPPGAICRRHYESRNGGLKAGEWFMVLTEPKETDGLSPRVKVVWLTGKKAGVEQKKYLGDMGVIPPYRVTCEKHELQIPERFVNGIGSDSLVRMASSKVFA